MRDQLSGQISTRRRLTLMTVTRAAPLSPFPPPPLPPPPPLMASLVPPHSHQMAATSPKAYLARRRRMLVVTVLMASWLIGSGSRVMASQLQQQILQQQRHRKIDDRRMPFQETNEQLMASESASLTKSPDDGLAVEKSALSATDSVQQIDEASGHNSHHLSSSTEGANNRHVVRRRRRHVMRRPFPAPPSKRNSVSWLIAATLRTCKDSFGECLRQRRLQYSIRTHQMDMAMKSKVVA